MIKLNQMTRLQDTFKRLSSDPKFVKQLAVEQDERPIAGVISDHSKTIEEFSVLDHDRASLTLAFNFSDHKDPRAAARMATVIAEAAGGINSKSVSAKIYSVYDVPNQIERTFMSLRQRVGEHKAMKACAGMKLNDNTTFEWKQASLKGFSFEVVLYQNLHSFDTAQIQKQRESMSRDLRQNIEYHINKVMPVNHTNKELKVEERQVERSMSL